MSVWSDKSYKAYANKAKSNSGNTKKCCPFTTSGDFGSESKFGNSGSRSLPTDDFSRKPSNLYEFELTTNCSTSNLSFGSEAKEFSWNMSPVKSSVWNSSSKKSSWAISISGGSSGNSSGNVSMDWSATVDGVFLDEIRCMSEELNKKA